MDPMAPRVPEASTYIRNAAPWIDGTPASATVTPAGLYKKTANEVGVLLPGVGTTRTEPDLVPIAAPVVASLNELRLGMEYANVLFVVPPATNVVAMPVVPRNWMFPFIVESAGLTRMI